MASTDIYPIDLEQQPLNSALSKLARIGHFHWAARQPGYLEGDTLAPLKGFYTVRQAVAELFKSTGIQYQWAEGGTVLIITDRKVIEVPPPQQPVVRSPQIEEINVIGSHIRGSNSAAPVFQFDRAEIQNSGVATTQEFIKYLPQIFGGGASEGAISPIKGDGANFNLADANGVNLHGMGSDSTLVLVNGRRIAPVGFGNVVDLSGIPLSAIERIEIMADGASAIYGSDAVGGVVNIVLRKYYDGGETYIGYDNVITGSSDTYRFNQMVGKRWPTGNTLFSYSYTQRARVKAENLSSTRSATDPSDILGENTQHDAIFSLSQLLTEHVDVYVDTLYSARETDQNEANFGANIFNSRSIKQFNFIGGSNIDLNDSWQIDTSFLYSSSSTVLDTTGAFSNSNKTALDNWMLDTQVDGEVFQAWGGAAKFALGGQYRREAFAFEVESESFSDKEKSSRSINSVFAELFIPLIGDSNDLPWLERLELTLASRYEKYSDFGSSTNPKVGLLWAPIPDIKLRASYSTSFRAPLVFELSELVIGRASSILLLPDPQAPDGETPTLLVTGYNAGLQPEKAVSWTIGADITPAAIPGFQLSLTYFAIDFTDRIQTAFEGYEIDDALIDPRFVPVLIRSPDQELINYWTSQPYFIRREDVSTSEIEAFVDGRLRNIATVRERGLDVVLGYSLDTDVGEFTFRLNGTYLLTLESQSTETAPFVNILNTPYNPVNLKLRNSISWTRNGLTTSAFVNYVGRYKDTRSGQSIDINSWTTVDLNIRYDIEHNISSWWRGLAVSLGVNNLFEKEPPYVANTSGYNFDATNANPLGRRIFLNIIKKW